MKNVALFVASILDAKFFIFRLIDAERDVHCFTIELLFGITTIAMHLTSQTRFGLSSLDITLKASILTNFSSTFLRGGGTE